MLAHRILPTILCRGRAQVKGERFDSWRSVGLAAQAVRVQAARGVDEVMLLDVAATHEGRGPDLDLVRELAEDLFCPLAVGGGVRSVEDVRMLLRAGADKVVIGTAAIEDPRLVPMCSAVVGCQAIVVSLDVRNGCCHTRNGTVPWPSYDPVKAARFFDTHGAGEILLQAVDFEGTMDGYALALIRDVSQAVSIPVVASGGCAGYEDMRLAIEAGASAVAAGALFQFTDATPGEAAEYLKARGVEVRV